MDERSQLLKGVQRWFDHPQQVAHYTEEQPTGLMAAEAWLCESLPPSCRLLDVGCGAGRAALALARQGHTVIATDVSRAILGVAAGSAARQQLPLTCIQTGPLELPLTDECVDAVLAFKVYGYIPTRAARPTVPGPSGTRAAP
jgi:2-polyprenyl-3-methyl-5-hydroxy-6-metoxy-1,4-benzoquinol methylase